MTGTTLRGRHPLRVTTVIVALLSALLLSGCGLNGVWPFASSASGITVMSPEPQDTDVSTSTEIKVDVDHKTKPTVELTSADGRTVSGTFRPDGSSWVPERQLAYDTRYQVNVTAPDGEGDVAKETSTFTTMDTPERTTTAGLYPIQGRTVGVAMPIAIDFSRPVENRAAVEKRLFVTTTPKVEGSWHWFSDSEVHFRPKTRWEPGTEISVRAAIGGMPLGDGYYGARDRTAGDVTVGEDLRVEVDDATKQMTVTRDGEIVRTMPVSLGKRKSPSSSGKMVVMEKKPKAMFDSSTYGVPVNSADGYRTKVEHTMRLTWPGEFIHSAPWSVADQGRRNVSHGCINMAPGDARWLYERIKVGDPVTVKNTGSKVDSTAGWTDWDMSWDEYADGSALRS